jgi:hypothetical protein
VLQTIKSSILLVGLVAGCNSSSLEKNFFREHVADSVEQLRTYPLEQQYKIFRYGNDVVEPPLMELAVPIAERGATAIPFLTAQLNTDSDDFAVRDIVLILDKMALLKTYDVKGDTQLMTIAEARISGMRDKDWRRITSKMFQRIKQR